MTIRRCHPRPPQLSSRTAGCHPGPLAVIPHRRLSSRAAGCHPAPPAVIPHHRLSSRAAGCHPAPPAVIPGRWLSSRTAGCHPAPPAVIPHRRLSSHTTGCHPAPPAVIPGLTRDPWLLRSVLHKRLFAFGLDRWQQHNHQHHGCRCQQAGRQAARNKHAPVTA